MSDSAYIDKLIQRLRSIHSIGNDDELALRALPLRVQEIRTRQDIVREGDRPNRSCILFEGMACWYKTTGEGVRQILSFQIPGDVPDLHSLHLDRMDCSLATIGPCIVGFVEHEAIRDLCERRPRLASAFWRMTLIDGAIFREWVTNVGGRKALGRVAHMLCEQIARLGAVDLIADGFVCYLPLTQNDIADAAGLSTVHVNRALQELRRQKLLRFDKFKLEVLAWENMQEVGDFDPSYLALIDRDRRPTPATPGI